MTSVFPSLERAFDYSSHKGALVLLTGYATPDQIRRLGQTRLTAWLRSRNVRGSANVAARAVAAAKAQTVVLPGQDLTASIITELANGILTLDDRLKSLDAQIAATFSEHPQAAIIESMPGFGPFLGASLLFGANDLRAFPREGTRPVGLDPGRNPHPRRMADRAHRRRVRHRRRRLRHHRPLERPARTADPVRVPVADRGATRPRRPLRLPARVHQRADPRLPGLKGRADA